MEVRWTGPDSAGHFKDGDGWARVNVAPEQRQRISEQCNKPFYITIGENRIPVMLDESLSDDGVVWFRGLSLLRPYD